MAYRSGVGGSGPTGEPAALRIKPRVFEGSARALIIDGN